MPKQNQLLNNTKKIDFLVILILFLIILDLHSFGFFGRTTFPQDAAIVFEGAYRISIGQIPYQDFYVVMGPVVFLMQAFFNLFLGANLLSMFIHSLILSLIISSIFYYFLRKEFGFTMSFIFSIFLYISFQGLAFHPFYNYSTYFFFFLNIFLLLFYLNKNAPIPKYVFLLSSLLAALDFYTKQDIGALHVVLVLFYFMFNYKKQWKEILLYYIVPTVILITGTYILLINLTDFGYWFNLGQPPHNPRLSNLIAPLKILEIISSWKFYLSLAFLLLITLRKNLNLKPTTIKLMSLSLVVSIATILNNTLTGATRQLSEMSTPILIFFTWILIKDHIKNLHKKYKLSIGIILTIILLLTVNPFPTYGLITLNYLNPDVGRIDQGCYAGYPMFKEDLKGLNEIREVIENNEYSFISMTQYSFLYCDYNIKPPKNLPAWFDEGNSFYQQDISNIIQTILSNNPKVLLIQEAHSHQDPTLNQRFIDTFVSEGYKIHKTINQKATQRPITILVRVS